MTSLADCISGACGCSAAEHCKFKRCGNCAYPIGEDGKTLVDHSCEEWDRCPDCDGPLNVHRIYGAKL